MANSRRPGATGKYVKRPRLRLPGSGSGRSISPGIPQRFLSQDLHHRDLERLLFVRPLRREAFQLNGITRDVDAVARRVALVGGVRHLEKIGDVLQDSLLREREVLLQNLVLFLALGEVDKNLRLQAGVDVLGELKR